MNFLATLSGLRLVSFYFLPLQQQEVLEFVQRLLVLFIIVLALRLQIPDL